MRLSLRAVRPVLVTAALTVCGTPCGMGSLVRVYTAATLASMFGVGAKR